jgi:D-alanine-D-alanine ligase-like ATP-grasp enzyme
VFALAKRCYRTFDDVAMLALDVLIDDAGQPFFIEANPGGNTWHFSSADRGQALRARGTFLERQFNAFELAGDVFTRRALDEAL